MTNPPKRTGYRLTYDAECLYNDWQEIGGCTCFLGCAPCYSCCHYGNPISLEENDEAWELDEEEEEYMSRQDITDKSSPPKSDWFGYKYRVTPESSKLLQEAVFKDGGGWGFTQQQDVINTDKPFLVVRKNKEITFTANEDYFERHVSLPEKQPPQPAKKDFVVGKYYKYILAGLGVFKTGKYYKLFKAQGGLLFTEDMYLYMNQRAFDINSESDYDPNTARPAGYTAYVVFKQEGKWGSDYGGKEYAYKCSREDYVQWRELSLPFDEDVFAEVNVSGTAKKVKVLRIECKVDPVATKSLVKILPNVIDTEVKSSKIDDILTVTVTRETREVNFNQQEDVDMTNVTRRVVNVKFFDEDAGLDVADSLVAFYDNVVTQDSDESTVRELLMNLDVAAKIEAHNKVRAKTVDLEILRNTGNEVTLRPIKLKDLRIEVTKA